MDRTVLFTGGPMHGRSVPVPGSQPRVSAYDQDGRSVAYTVAKFVFCGRVIWIGHLGDKPDEDRAFDVLASDAAKAASYIAAVTAY